jgi:hypothetical protein
MRSVLASASTAALLAAYAPISGGDLDNRRQRCIDQQITAAFHDLRKTGADRPPGPEQVDLDHAVECFVVDRAQRPARSDASVWDHDINPAEALDRSLHSRDQRFAVSDVRLEPDCVRSALCGHTLQFSRLQPDKREVCSSVAQAAGALGADAACGSGDQNRLAVDQIARHGWILSAWFVDSHVQVVLVARDALNGAPRPPQAGAETDEDELRSRSDEAVHEVLRQ